MQVLKSSSPAYFLFLFFLAGLTGCAAHLRKAAIGSFIDDVATATAKHDDVTLVAQAAPTYLLLLEGLLEGNPDDQELLIEAAELYTSYGALVEIDDPDWARNLYHRAKTYGLKALARNKHIGPLLTAPYSDFIRIQDHLETRDVPLVFWAASSWGAWISASTDSMGALADLPKVIWLMEWVLQKDEKFYYGSPHIFLGVYHAALPRALGGNPEKALQHFDRALEISQHQSLMAYVNKARFYARQIFDRELYESLLKTVLQSPIDQVPELTLQNATARQIAQKLLEETDEFF